MAHHHIKGHSVLKRLGVVCRLLQLWIHSELCLFLLYTGPACLKGVYDLYANDICQFLGSVSHSVTSVVSFFMHTLCKLCRKLAAILCNKLRL